jgi:hypothetical protein
VYALVLFSLAAAVVVVLLLLTRNANLLFVASVRKGRIAALKGRLPKRLARDLEDVLRARPVSEATLRVIVRDRRPFLETAGDVQDEERQRLRNVLGTWQTARIRAAPFQSGPLRR